MEEGRGKRGEGRGERGEERGERGEGRGERGEGRGERGEGRGILMLTQQTGEISLLLSQRGFADGCSWGNKFSSPQGICSLRIVSRFFYAITAAQGQNVALSTPSRSFLISLCSRTTFAPPVAARQPLLRT